VEAPTSHAGATPPLDLAGIERAFEIATRSVGGLDRPAARRLLERLRPDRWTLEWYLPWWLGHGLALDAEMSRELVVSNLLGLASIRLQDDLADGELSDSDAAAAPRMASALYRAAVAPYAMRFRPESPFWSHLDRVMAEWRAAAADTDGAHPLAARGAPLKVAVFAECLLADRVATYPALEIALDHALEALVRYDHVADWRKDLEAGRWNAFVAAVSPGPQTPAARARRQRDVMVAMLTTDAVLVEFASVRDGFLAAAAAAAELARTDDLRLPDLVEHLRRRAAEAESQGSAFATHYHVLADEAAKRLFTLPPDGGS
jgi:hypothetical protein